jgi:hypothetical protein
MIQKCEWQELFQLLKAADPEARNVIGFWMILGIFGDCPINNDKPITFCFYELCKQSKLPMGLWREGTSL